MVKHYEIIKLTDNEYDEKYLGEQVKELVTQSGVKNGIVTVITAHTSTGIIVTEPLDCILSDVQDLLRKLADDNGEYAHAHFLPTYGRTSANCTGHLRSILVGNNCVFPIQNGKMLMGAAQEIIFLEFDGPQKRTIFVDIIGE